MYCGTELPAAQYYAPQQPYPPGYGYQTYQYRDPEVQGLIPNRYDAIFYSGVGLYILLLFALLSTQGNPVIYILMIFSIALPILAIYGDFKYNVRSTTGTLGNICGIAWIVFQIIGTIILGMMFV
jgi:hypothetical protein